jgi:CDP-diacylglycerol--glycerol-3-phosphate 3-phosphatidyltransferase
MTDFVLLSEKNRQRYLKCIEPISHFLAKMNVNPNVLSVFGLLFSILAGVLYSLGLFFAAAFVVILAGASDTLDGQIARRTGRSSQFGAFFDSTLDRYSDLFMLLGMAWFFLDDKESLVFNGNMVPTEPHPWTVLMIILAMTGSFMISYCRARAEGLGLSCNVGLMQRPERIILILAGSLLSVIPVLGIYLMKTALFMLAISTNITAVHRILHVRTQLTTTTRERE